MATPQYWEMSQVIACLRTGSEAAAEAVIEPQSVHTLCREVWKSKRGQRLIHFRRFSSRPLSFRSEPVPNGESPGGTAIVEFLMESHARGWLSCQVRRVGQREMVEYGPHEAKDSVFQIHPDDPKQPFGYWSKTTGECRGLEPRFRRDQIVRLVRPARLRQTMDAEDHLLALLMNMTANGPVAKDDARELCSADPEYWARGFERAWKRIPPERKLRRGQHGARMPH
jgi:hypothetical protein